MFTRRNLLRLLLLVVFALLASGTVPEDWRPWRVLLPALSPLLNLGGAVAARTFGWLTLLSLPLLVLPLFKGRFFCWRLCPMGFVAETVSRINTRNAGLVRRVPFIGQALAPVIAGSALFGYPLFIWTDPLCLFNGFFAAWHTPLAWATSATALGFALIVLASLLAPNVWCHRLCPLGGLEELLTRAGHRLHATGSKAREHAPGDFAADVHVARRTFLGAAVGGAAGIAYRRIAGKRPANAVRPPGAAQPAFNALCSRCGNCMKACPYGLIVPDLGSTGIDGLFTPILKFRSTNADQESFCFQGCTACTQVCPSGAIRRLTPDDKLQTAIGLARIDQQACIAWKKAEYCVVCQEFCPYQAIIETPRNGVNCPIVVADKCRGCGACESQCPSQPIAIVIVGRTPQVRLTSPAPKHTAQETSTKGTRS